MAAGDSEAELAVIRQTLAQLTNLVAQQQSPLVTQLAKRQLELEQELLGQKQQIQQLKLFPPATRPASSAPIPPAAVPRPVPQPAPVPAPPKRNRTKEQLDAISSEVFMRRSDVSLSSDPVEIQRVYNALQQLLFRANDGYAVAIHEFEPREREEISANLQFISERLVDAKQEEGRYQQIKKEDEENARIVNKIAMVVIPLIIAVIVWMLFRK